MSIETSNRFSVIVAGLLVGALPTALAAAPGQASLLPPSSRAQLISEPGSVPTRSIPYVITPERRALLNTIRFAEGTWKGGFDIGYRVMFGGSLMKTLDRHPDHRAFSIKNLGCGVPTHQGHVMACHHQFGR